MNLPDVVLASVAWAESLIASLTFLFIDDHKKNLFAKSVR